ncbi:MAG: sigma-70 family RNA polymerase sigma factor [Planctomycetes bacterium]|nr:sigma-70 family RNA polymerase sigma factor [Planctomycetota bacterium]
MTRTDPETLFLAWRQTGDPAALGAVFDATAPELQRLAERLCGRGPDADDVLQATFLAAIESADRFDPTRRLVPWLVGIMTLHVRRLHERRQRRREQPRASDDVPSAAPSPAQSATQAELHGELHAAIAQLPPLQRLVVEACLVQQVPPHEVAGRLGIPEGTCRMRLHRGLESLRALLPAGFAGTLLAMLPAGDLPRLRKLVVEHAAGLRPRAALRLWTRPAPTIAATVAVLLTIGLVVQFALADHAPEPVALDPATPPAVVQAVVPPRSASEEPRPRPSAAARRSAVDADVRATLAVEFVFADGSPAAAVGVDVSQPDGARDFRANLRHGVADANGRAMFADLRPGFAYALTDRDVADRFELTAGETTSARMVVPRGTAIQGVVVGPDGSPIAAAEVRLIVRGDIAQTLARTAADGSFAVADVPTRNTGLMAFAEGHGPSHPTPMGVHMEPLRFTLTAPTELCGTVTDVDGVPVRGATVGALRRLELPWSAMPESRTFTDDRGHFRFTELGVTDVRLMVAAKGHAPWQTGCALAPGPTQVPIRLQRGQSLRGRLQSRTGASPGIAVVEVVTGAPELGHQRITGLDGRFEVDAIHAGPITLFVQALGFQRLLTTLPARDDDTELVVWLDPAVVCNGVLVDTARRPLAGWCIGFDRHGTNLETTAGDGRFACHVPAGAVDACWVAPPISPSEFPREFHRLAPPRLPTDGSLVEIAVDPAAPGTCDPEFVPESRQPPFVPRRTLLAFAPDGSRAPYRYELHSGGTRLLQGTTWLPTRLPFPQPADGEVRLRDADGREFRATFTAAELAAEHPTVLGFRQP